MLSRSLLSISIQGKHPEFNSDPAARKQIRNASAIVRSSFLIALKVAPACLVCKRLPRSTRSHAGIEHLLRPQMITWLTRSGLSDAQIQLISVPIPPAKTLDS